MATVGQDNFTDTADTFLENHTASVDVGLGWQVQAVEEWIIGATTENHVAEDTGTQNSAKKLDDIGSEEMDVTVNVVNGKHDDAASSAGGMVSMPSADIATSTNRDGYAAVIIGDAGTTTHHLKLFRVTDGSRTELGDYDTLSTNTSQSWEIKIQKRSSGTRIEVILDGTSRITSNDADHTGQFAGIHAESADATVDNFLSEDVGAVTAVFHPDHLIAYSI